MADVVRDEGPPRNTPARHRPRDVQRPSRTRLLARGPPGPPEHLGDQARPPFPPDSRRGVQPGPCSAAGPSPLPPSLGTHDRNRGRADPGLHPRPCPDPPHPSKLKPLSVPRRVRQRRGLLPRSEEHTSELQSRENLV